MTNPSDSDSSSSASSSPSSSDSGSAPASPQPNASGSGSNSPASNKSSSPEAPKPSANRPSGRGRRAAANSSSEDENDQHRKYFDDDEEFRAWRQKSEKEREQIILDKMDQADARKTREEIEKRLAARNAESKGDDKKRKKKDSESDSDTEFTRPPKADSDSDMDVEYHHPSELDRKRKHNQAMSDLVQKRKVKEQKESAKQNVLSIDDVFGKEGNDSDNESSSSSSSSSNSSRSSSSSRESSPARASDDDVVAEQHPVETVVQLNRARMSRYKITRLVHAPFFKDVMVGSYVRIQTGPISESSSRYHIARVIDVCEMPKPYDLEGTRTNRGIKIKFGRHEKAYRAEYVSNTAFEQAEFQEWMNVTMRDDDLPTVESCEAKEKQIKEAFSHRYTEKEVAQMIEEKKKFNKISRNFAMEKGELMKLKEGAEQTGDLAAAQGYQRQIEEIEAEADEIERARSANTRAVLWINQRNRNKMKESFLGDKIITQESTGDDPFTRKKERMKVVCGRGSGTSAPVAETPKPTIIKTPVNEPPAKKKNLFELAGSIPAIKIDIDLSRLNSSITDQRRRFESSETNSSPSIAPAIPSSGRQITLAEYRRRKEKQAAANAEASTSQQ